MNRLGFLILSILNQNQAYNRIGGMTLKEISDTEDFGYKENTIYKQIRNFKENKLVAVGAKEGKAITYYITEKGREILRKERAQE